MCGVLTRKYATMPVRHRLTEVRQAARKRVKEGNRGRAVVIRRCRKLRHFLNRQRTIQPTLSGTLAGYEFQSVFFSVLRDESIEPYAKQFINR